MKSSRQAFYAIVSTVLFVSLIIALLNYVGANNQVIEFLQWVRSAGVQGQVIFFMTVALTVIFLLPGVVLTMAAGFLYGIFGGTVIIVLAETLGACVAFVFARSLLHGRMIQFLESRNLLSSMGVALTRHGWRLIALIRMIPFFPFKLSNYFFGLTPVSFRQYLVGTLIGLCPLSVFNVYLGSIAGDLMSLDSVGSSRTPLQWAVYIFGFVAVMLAVYMLARRAQRIVGREEVGDDRQV